MVVGMIDLVELVESNRYIQSEFFPSRRRKLNADLSSFFYSTRLLYSPPYPAVGNYRREEAIMLLRRFYLTENTAGGSRFTSLSDLNEVSADSFSLL